MKKPKISAEVSTEEFEAYKAEAARRGMTLSEWLRLSLNSALPTATSTPAVADAAFKQLDDQDRIGGVMASVEQPVAEKPAPSFQKLPPAPVTDHPCVYLNPQRPGVLTTGECSGTCLNSSQRGKPCFFAAPFARRCPVFASRTVPSAPVQDMRARK